MASVRRLSGLLVLVFLLSGISGLIYQVVWMRMLIRVFGVTTFAVSTVLCVFMLGLALGSFAAGRWFGRGGRLLEKYAVVEVGIGLSAVASTAMIPLLPGWMRSAVDTADESMVGVALIRLLLSAVVLIVPTFLMGTTLPLLSGFVARHRDGAGRAAGLLYGVNTLGAVVGVVASGFVLIMLLGERNTVYLAAAVNIAVGALAFGIARRSSDVDAPASDVATEPSSEITPATLRWVTLIFAASGFAALGYEVVWTRVLGVILGSSVYAFSSMLALYLTGIALGSFAMSRVVDRLKDPLFVFCMLEFAVAILALGSLHVFQAVGLATAEPRHVFSQLWSMADIYRLPLFPALIVLPVTLILGAIFPVVARIGASAGGTVTEAIGRLYGANTIGSILGSFAAGFVLLPLLGTVQSFLLLSLASAALGVALFTLSDPSLREKRRVSVATAALAFVAVGAVSFQDPFYAIFMARGNGFPETGGRIRHVEDTAATVTVFHNRDGSRHLWINGYIVSSYPGQGDFMTDVPAVFHPAPESQLIIGFGVGESFRTALDNGFETTVAELVPTVVEQFPHIHPDDHEKYLTNPKGHIVFNDGRNHLVGTRDRYDLILLDSSPPLFGPSMVSLTSLDFMTQVRDHLTEDGIFTFWLPMVCFEDDFWSITHNFTETFDQIAMWIEPGTAGVMLLGTNSPDPILQIDAESFARRAEERGLGSSEPDFAGRTMRGFRVSEEAVRAYAQSYPLVTDDRPLTEFPLLRFFRGAPLHRNSQFVLDSLNSPASARIAATR